MLLCSIYSIKESLKRQAHYFLNSHETQFSILDSRFLQVLSFERRVSILESKETVNLHLSSTVQCGTMSETFSRMGCYIENARKPQNISSNFKLFIENLLNKKYLLQNLICLEGVGLVFFPVICLSHPVLLSHREPTCLFVTVALTSGCICKTATG